MTLALWATPFVDYSGAGSKIPASFANLVRLALPNAIDGAGGGTYTPTAVIFIDGVNGLKVKTTVVPNGGTVHIQSGATFTIDASGSGLVNGILDINNGATLHVNNGGFLTAYSTSTVNLDGTTTFDTNSAVTFKKNVTFNGTSVVATTGTCSWTWGASTTIAYTAGAAVSGTIADASTTTRTGPTTYSGNNGYVQRRYIAGADANTTYVGNRMDAIHAPRLTTSDRTYTLDPTDGNVQSDVEIFWYCFGDHIGSQYFGTSTGSSTKDLTIVSSTGSVNILWIHNPTFGAANIPGFYYAKFHYDGANWKSVCMQVP